MKKLRFWLIKKLIKNTPVIMNVTLTVSGELDIQGAETVGIFDKWHVAQVDEKEEKNNGKTKNRNTRRREARANR